MADMKHLTEFLRARLDEDEAAARAAQVLAATDHELAQQAGPCVADPAYAHIARHGPARVLREVWVKRALLILWECQDGYDLPPGVQDGRDDAERFRDEWVKNALETVIMTLATVYSDHPDYRQEWAV